MPALAADGRVLPRRDRETAPATPSLCGVGTVSTKSATDGSTQQAATPSARSGVAPDRAHHRGIYFDRTCAYRSCRAGYREPRFGRYCSARCRERDFQEMDA